MTKRIGVFVDGENIKYNGGFHIRYNSLKKFAARDGGTIQRMNTYLALDNERYKSDAEYKKSVRSFQDALRDTGWKICEKSVKWFSKPDGSLYSKANADVDITVDIIRASERLDKIILVTGDGDFISLVEYTQKIGCQVEVVGFQNVSKDLQKSCDLFMSGYLIPGLVADASEDSHAQWGNLGSKVRGVCFQWNQTRNFGFMRYIRNLNKNITVMDNRDPESAYDTCFFHISDLPKDFDSSDLANRDIIFSFNLEKSTDEKNIVAKNIEVAYRYDK
jgi:uncharacterized LabA/DUF88 family protein